MTRLGKISLKFGATGAAGEEITCFQSAPINLIVGPNNAGKSLMLRELSGVDPRGDRRARSHAHDHVVGTVEWHEEVERRLRETSIAEVFARSDPSWADLGSRSWDQILPALEEAIPLFREISGRLCQDLLAMAKNLPTDGLREFAGFVEAFISGDYQKSSSMIVGIAFTLLMFTRLEEAESADSSTGVAKRPKGPLKPAQAAKVQKLLAASWSRCEAMLQRLGVDARGLSFTDLINANAFGGALLHEFAKLPFLGDMIRPRLAVLKGIEPSAETLAQVQRFTRVGGWLIDPAPLARLLDSLREAYARGTWAAQRAQLARDVLYLDGLARLEVTQSAKLRGYDRETTDPPAILALLRNPARMDELRRLTVDALGGYLVIDMTTQSPDVVWRLAASPPAQGLESSYSDAASKFHAAAEPLDERSDGIHAFVGMLAAIVAKPADLVMIDEPEAFLHPRLIRNFGRVLTTLARDTQRQFFIATHSADLLESFVAGGSTLNIVRLTYDRGRATARLLDCSTLHRLARDPLLRSEATLSALFYDGAVVCEAAGDRVLYKEINERLLNGGDELGLDSCVFLNAQNWQTIARMISPLRRMGVAAAAVVDADVLFGADLSNILVAAQIDRVIRQGWVKLRDGLREKIGRRLGVDMKDTVLKGEDIARLTPAEHTIFAELRASMAKYGVFIVPLGELENWLTPLGVKPRLDDKGRWLREALERLGTDPQSVEYVHPAKDDIWEFIRGVNAWIRNPTREGTSPKQAE